MMRAISGFVSVIAYVSYDDNLFTVIGYIFSPTNEFGLANLNLFLSALFVSCLVEIVVSYAPALRHDDLE